MMRVGLIAALKTDREGSLRASLPLAGRSVLAWQGALLQSLGVERVVCLTATHSAEILALQHSIESGGAAFHALAGFAALPALVRAEDDLFIIADGLVPDAEIVRGMFTSESALHRMVAAFPADHPLAAAFPEDFERIDASRNWAGVLAMRGAPVQQLADFPADADAVSLLLRLALQSGTPLRDLAAHEPLDERWILADDGDRVAAAGEALIASAAGPRDWRAPMEMLAGLLARALVQRGQGQGGLVAGGIGLALLMTGVMTAAFGPPAAGLLLAGLGTLGLRVAQAHAALARRLQDTVKPSTATGAAVLGAVSDLLTALLLWFALAPWPSWQPLAVLGPVTVGLAVLAAPSEGEALARPAADRASWLLVLALASAFDLLPEALACLALGLLTALLLRGRKT